MDRLVEYLVKVKPIDYSNDRWAKELGIDPGLWSKIRRGKLEPSADFRMRTFNYLINQVIGLVRAS